MLLFSLSLFLCVFLSLFIFRFGLLPACTKTKQAAAAAAAAAAVKFQQRPGPEDACLAGVQHAHCKRLSHATRIPNTHAPTTKESSSEALQQSTCLASLHNGNKATAARTAHHQRSQAGEALAVLI